MWPAQVSREKGGLSVASVKDLSKHIEAAAERALELECVPFSSELQTQLECACELCLVAMLIAVNACWLVSGLSGNSTLATSSHIKSC